MRWKFWQRRGPHPKLAAAVEEQRQFEATHPIPFAEDQRVTAIVQRAAARGRKVSPADVRAALGAP
jgi:hypothetical protein